MDVNAFQLHLKSEELFKEEISLWEKKPKLLDYLRQEIGHSVEIKQSEVDHHEAGDGVFVHTRGGQSLLPGTLIGFYPGVINGPLTPLPEKAGQVI